MEKKKIMTVVIIVIVVAVAVVFGVVFGMKFAGDNSDKDKEVDILSEDVQQLEVGEMYSNLAESKKIVKLNVTIAVNDADLLTLMESRMSIIKDEINKSLRGKVEGDMVGLSGQVNLKTELLNSLNEIFRTKDIVDIYFNEIIVQ